ncbi:hypothetical protein H2204_008969 [Knufia peltigerae]|uniref:Uncharacterized protein n=1 Tax=Knufia peltigerae TaxID=1002370 RepID=A0AA38Y0B2_9EURO|nr:hypothetical protein H2204_008969 [Knufia peltigerae]
MKFMQRAAASTSSSPVAATPSSSAPGDYQPSKRRRFDLESFSASSTPGTPQAPTTSEPQISTFGQSRGGTSTFDRGEGADTEWVLDLKMSFPDANQKNGDSVNGTRFGRLPQDNDGDADSDEEDIWSNRPSGRQTYGSFKTKRKSRPQAKRDVDGGEESPSEEEEDGEEHDHSKHRTPTRNRKRRSSSNGADSDEEMRQVRRAIETKHRNMSGQGQTPRASPAGTGWNSRLPITGGGVHGQKRRRDDGNYKAHKKARKTI